MRTEWRGERPRGWARSGAGAGAGGGARATRGGDGRGAGAGARREAAVAGARDKARSEASGRGSSAAAYARGGGDAPSAMVERGPQEAAAGAARVCAGGDRSMTGAGKGAVGAGDRARVRRSGAEEEEQRSQWGCRGSGAACSWRKARTRRGAAPASGVRRRGQGVRCGDGDGTALGDGGEEPGGVGVRRRGRRRHGARRQRGVSSGVGAPVPPIQIGRERGGRVGVSSPIRIGSGGGNDVGGGVRGRVDRVRVGVRG